MPISARPQTRPHRRLASGCRLAVAVLMAGLSLSACSLAGGSQSSEASNGAAPTSVTLVTHESFALPDELIAAFESRTGLTLEVRAAADAGTLTNKLVLTQGSPTGDVAFGVDNTFASRALDADVFVPYTAELPEGVAQFALPTSDGGTDDRLVPIDNANVCINIDTGWFEKRGIPAPATLADLVQPRYKGLTVLPGAATSSPGMAFLLATIEEYGEEGWADYWAKLMRNGVKLTSGWSDAYFVDFTQGGGPGKRPIVLSYDSSPAFTVPKGGDTSATAALLDTCFQQVEYAGILDGAANPEGASELIGFLLSDEVQAALPESMYVFPVHAGVPLPKAWASFAIQPAVPRTLDPQLIADHRDDWLREWTDVTSS
ncbi:MAG: thiamine ABC transporter substrate-binding protein [Nocardioides sp.]